MVVEFADFVELIKALAWPLVAVVGFFVFRMPLSRFVEELGKRANKLSAFNVSIEFAMIPSPPVPWSSYTFFESSSLPGGYLTDDTIAKLFQWIHDDLSWPYLIVDIENGRRWLISRLFLFTVILRYLRGLKCVVFVETKDEYRKRFLGIAKPESVCLALKQKYHWLNESLIKVWCTQNLPVYGEPLLQYEAKVIVEGFMKDDRIQIHNLEKIPQEELQRDWEKLREDTWEHSKWLNIERINVDLRPIFYDHDDSQFIDSPSISARRRNKEVLCRKAPFIAMVNDKGEFKGLVDRQVFLNQVITHLLKQSDDT